MNKTKTYIFYDTGTHGYLRVKKEELKRLKIINDISEYSFNMLRNNILLEEDCDLALFVRAKDRVKEDFKIKTVNRSPKWVENSGLVGSRYIQNSRKKGIINV
tara:strand:- start:677 stop:985 length:309 start_codon:yes stop_codon:yes gene_type:complete